MPKTFHGKRIWIISFTIIVLVVLFLSFPPLLTGVRNTATAILTAPLKAIRYTGRYLETKRELSEENIQLRREIGELSLMLETYKELREENERLRELLMFKRRVGYETVSAEVIARDPTTGSAHS